MTTAALRVPRQPPVPRSTDWFKVTGPPYAFVGSDICSEAAYYNGVTYVGVIDGDGNARVLAYNHSTWAVTVSPVVVSGVGADVHVSPAVLVRSSDHKIVLAVAPHSSTHMYVAISTNAQDISAWGAASDIFSTLGATLVTYQFFVQLSGESGKIYLFFRNAVTETSPTNRLCYSTSTDGGATWSALTEVYENANKQAYWVIASDGASRIDFVVADGNASSGDTASLYHFYKSGSSYYKSDGTLITASLPLAPASLTKIYDGTTNGSVRVPYSLVEGSPTVAFAAWDPAGSGQPEKYWYAIFSGGAWSVHQIDTSGSTPDSNFSEGGVAVDRTNTSRVFVARKVSGQWQIFIYTTADGGVTWTNKQLTSDADQPNIRPLAPQNAVSTLSALWCYGPHWTNGSGVEPSPAQLRGYPNPRTVT